MAFLDSAYAVEDRARYVPTPLYNIFLDTLQLSFYREAREVVRKYEVLHHEELLDIFRDYFETGPIHDTTNTVYSPVNNYINVDNFQEINRKIPRYNGHNISFWEFANTVEDCARCVPSHRHGQFSGFLGNCLYGTAREAAEGNELCSHRNLLEILDFYSNKGLVNHQFIRARTSRKGITSKSIMPIFQNHRQMTQMTGNQT